MIWLLIVAAVALALWIAVGVDDERATRSDRPQIPAQRKGGDHRD